MAFHKSNFGRFGSSLPADMDGYVPEEGDSPWTGNWDHAERTHDEAGELTEYGQWWEEEGFPEKLERAIQAVKYAEESLEEWRNKN